MISWKCDGFRVGLRWWPVPLFMSLLSRACGFQKKTLSFMDLSSLQWFTSKYTCKHALDCFHVVNKNPIITENPFIKCYDDVIKLQQLGLTALHHFSESWLSFLLKNSKICFVEKSNSLLVEKKKRCRSVNCLLSSVLSPSPYLPACPGFSLRQQFFSAGATFCRRSP